MTEKCSMNRNNMILLVGLLILTFSGMAEKRSNLSLKNLALQNHHSEIPRKGRSPASLRAHRELSSPNSKIQFFGQCQSNNAVTIHPHDPEYTLCMENSSEGKYGSYSEARKGIMIRYTDR